MATLTSANSIVTITATTLFPIPQQLQGYAVDKAWSSDSLVLSETKMGVDGKLSAGYTPNPTKVTFSLQADSASRDIFKAITQATKTSREIFFISASISLPATGENFTLNRGVLTETKQTPDGEKMLGEVEYVVTFESVDAAIL